MCYLFLFCCSIWCNNTGCSLEKDHKLPDFTGWWFCLITLGHAQCKFHRKLVCFYQGKFNYCLPWLLSLLSDYFTLNWLFPKKQTCLPCSLLLIIFFISFGYFCCVSIEVFTFFSEKIENIVCDYRHWENT